ncbi:hypothetical protein [Actinomadura parmotrematis]|uniref:Uncharacterized protein n=1 Tax=Actinomadura parmotrematis TaxID=2864039 RepID=A0ABS7G434_9ACTN|nr:hypothetical protein [Actinomadura parmotrematis]MBW8487306.1 hypothetical protein [Actinomadura parmotrematis]
MADKGFKINRRAIEKMQKEIGKEFERAARKHPIRVPIEANMPDVSTEGGRSAKSSTTIEDDPYQSLLLSWLYGQSPERRIVDISTFTADRDLSQDDARAVVLQLKDRNLIKVSESLTGINIYEIRLTETGVIEARRLQGLRKSRIARFSYACDGLLRWAFEAGRGEEGVETMAFMDTAGSYFAGDSLTVDEVLGASRYLEQRCLMQRVGTDDGAESLSRVRVTEDGVDCALSGRTVNDYINHQKQSGDTYNFHGSSGIVAGSQRSVVQYNSIGFDPSEMGQFADLVLQMAPTLGMAPDKQEELIQDAEILAEETSASQPEPGKIRAAYGRIQETLAAANATSVGLTLLVQNGKQAYQTVFGG